VSKIHALLAFNQKTFATRAANTTPDTAFNVSVAILAQAAAMLGPRTHGFCSAMFFMHHLGCDTCSHLMSQSNLPLIY